MADKGDVYTPLHSRSGKIQPKAVTMEHLSLGSEFLEGGDLQDAVLFTEISVTRANSRAVLKAGTSTGHIKIVKIAEDSKSVGFHPAGSERIVMGPGDVWLGVWNGSAWITVFCSVTPSDEKPAGKVKAKPEPEPDEPA